MTHPEHDRDVPSSRDDPGGLSVVIPCHNASATIADQLEALTRQTYRGPWEVVIVDNLSSDDLSGAIRAYEDALPSVKVVRAEEKANLGYARNVGVHHARYDRILFCDGDDVVCPEWLEAMAGALDRAPFVTGPLELERLNPAHVAQSRGAQTSGLQNKFSFLPHGTGGNSAVLRTANAAIGGWDEDIPSLEDTDYFWKAQLAGFEVAYEPDAVIHYRLRSDFAGILRQARQYATADVFLHKRYERDGLARIKLSSGAKGWIRIVLHLPKLVKPAGRVRFAWLLGYRLGRLKGALRYRVVAL